MKRLILAMFRATAGGSGMGLTTHPALAASLCVGSGSGCYSTIRAALNAAHSGDMIQVSPGTFAGGITIDVSVSVMGAGTGKTIIHGGGPVVTTGSADATSEPTVSISEVTITGGVNTSVPDTSQPRGGGIWIPPAAEDGPGATVKMTGVVITGNRVRASQSGDCGDCGDCGAGCTFAFSRGGGIANFGTMTLTNTIVSNNQAIFDLSPAPDNAGAYGGGIKNNGTLTLRDSTVSGNIARFTTAVLNQTDRSGQGAELTVTDRSPWTALP